jgi:two-component sensor histidine kinase
MIRYREWRLRTTLVVLLALTTLATLATLVTVGSGLLLWRLPQVRQENVAQVQREARQLAERMEILLGGLQRRLELAGAALAQLPQNPPTAFLDALTAEGQSFEVIYLADRDGTVEAVSLSLKSSAHPGELVGSDLSANRLYRLASQRQATVWSDKFLSALSGHVPMGIAIPVGSRMLIGELPLTELLRTLHVVTTDPRLSVWVIDRRGELVAETGTTRKLGPVNLLGLPMVQAALGGSPLPDTVTIRGEDFHPAVARSDIVDWFFLVRMPAGLNNPDIRSTAALVVVALLGCLLIGTLLAPLFALRISRPMRAITDRVRQIVDGKPSGDWPRGPISELNALAVDLETMSNHLQERQDQLREAQRIAGIGSWEYTNGSDSITWSEGLHLLLRRDVGLGPPTFPTLSRFYTPESWERLGPAIARALEAGVSYELELEMIRDDGTSCWTTTRGEAVCGPDGVVVSLRGTVHDITERKQAEEKIRSALAEKDVLLKEIYHRVKNNLQVVSSLLNLQSRRVADTGTKQLLDDSANRVKSMALVHEQLYRAENLSSISLPEYLQQLASHLVNVNRPISTRVLLSVEADELFVGVESAIPLGLVVNELVSNAYRHSYNTDAAGGEIVVRVTGLPGGRVCLEVKDDGPGLPADFEPGKRGTLGMQLVVTLARQLGGELTWNAGHQGACFALQFKPETLSTQQVVA